MTCSIWRELPHRDPTSRVPKGEFLNYLDQLCSQLIDASDLAAFDANELREKDQRVRSVAKVFCGRVGHYGKLDDVAYPKRAQPDAAYGACEAYWRRFRYSVETSVQGGMALTFPDRRALFYQTSATPLRFHVCRGDALKIADAAREGTTQSPGELLSTIFAVVPAVAWTDVERQIVNPIKPPHASTEWGKICEASMEERRRIAVAACEAPDASALPAGGKAVNLLPCSTLAHVVEDGCKWVKQGDVEIRRPAFPQDSLVGLTLHIPYTSYAAYFDLGRAQVRRALGNGLPDKPDDDNRACAIPK